MPFFRYQRDNASCFANRSRAFRPFHSAWKLAIRVKFAHLSGGTLRRRSSFERKPQEFPPGGFVYQGELRQLHCWPIFFRNALPPGRHGPAVAAAFSQQRQAACGIPERCLTPAARCCKDTWETMRKSDLCHSVSFSSQLYAAFALSFLSCFPQLTPIIARSSPAHLFATSLLLIRNLSTATSRKNVCNSQRAAIAAVFSLQAFYSLSISKKPRCNECCLPFVPLLVIRMCYFRCAEDRLPNQISGQRLGFSACMRVRHGAPPPPSIFWLFHCIIAWFSGH